MQRLKHHITVLRQECEAAQQSADGRARKTQLDQLLHDVQAEPEVDIPAQLHQAGLQTLRLVSPHDIACLHEGTTIARAVRALLPHSAGNQRLAVSRSHGRSVTLTFGAQTLSDFSSDPSWQATSAVLVGAGNCDEAARIAFEIARSRDIPAAIVGDHQAGHTFTLLYPDNAYPVVVDGWPIFPSSCLLDDSPFQIDRIVIKHQAGDPLSTPFNLPVIDALRQRVHDQLGENAIENLMVETLRQQYQLRLSSLDRLLLDQGLLHYHQLQPERMNVEQRALFDTKCKKLKLRMNDLILHQVANLISTQSTESEPQQRLWKNGLGSAEEWESASETARRIACEKAQQRARADSNKLVMQQAKRNLDRCADLEISRSDAHTEMRGLAVVTAESTVTVNARAKPTLWHYLLHGGNIRYQSPGGRSYSVATAPQSLIDATFHAQTATEKCGYPDTYRSSNYDPDHHTTSRQGDVSDAELMQHCVAKIAEHLAGLRSSAELPQSAQRAAREIDLLHEIDERFEDVAPAIQHTVLTQLAELLAQLHPDSLTVAVAHWMRWQGGNLPGEFFPYACIALRKTWFTHLGKDSIESNLRPAVLRCTNAASVIEFAAAQLPLQLHHHTVLFNVIDFCWPQLSDDISRAKAQRQFANALDKINHPVIKKSGQKILERHRLTDAIPSAQASSTPLIHPDRPL